MMQNVIWPVAGRYIVAVSGGADSMVLLHVLAGEATERGYVLTVAHFDHGLRPESGEDRDFVRAAAAEYGLPFETHEAGLGQASEAAARQHRQAWLQKRRSAHQAAAIITAHHQDDLVETSLLNLARGSGRRGLAPMQPATIIRPFLRLTRADLRAYAATQHLAWREDPTNADTSNPRNYLRHRLLAQADAGWQSAYVKLIEEMALLSKNIDNDLAKLMQLETDGVTIKRNIIRDLDLSETAELLVTAAYHLEPTVQLDSRAVQEVALFMKTGRTHHRRDLSRELSVDIGREEIHVRIKY